MNEIICSVFCTFTFDIFRHPVTESNIELYLADSNQTPISGTVKVGDNVTLVAVLEGEFVTSNKYSCCYLTMDSFNAGRLQ